VAGAARMAEMAAMRLNKFVSFMVVSFLALNVFSFR